MAKASAGILLYRRRQGHTEVLLVHPGGPFWARKDAGAWFVPKGELEPGEDELTAAQREFEEESGIKPQGEFRALGSVKNKSGKTITAWGLEYDWDPNQLRSNTFELEWPPRSGKKKTFPEIDRAQYFPVEEAREKMHPAEFAFVERLVALF